MDATALLRPHLLDGCLIALGGDDRFAAPLTALGARTAPLPATLDEEQMAAAVDPATAALVHDLRPAFERAGGADALRAALDLAWVTVRAVANAAFIPQRLGGKLTLVAPAPEAGPAAAAVRAAVENLARTLSIEWARHDITTVAITPGGGHGAGGSRRGRRLPRLVGRRLLLRLSACARRGQHDPRMSSDLDFGVDDVLAEIGEDVRRARCILLLGAGVHAAPPPGSAFTYPDEHRPPLGEQLGELLAKRSGLLEALPYESPRDLQRVALFYEISRSRKLLVEAIADAVQRGKRPSPMVHALARLDFPVVLTTNYDDLFEQALRQAGKEPLVVVYSRQRGPQVAFDDLSPDRPIVFKLHGDIEQRESIVITEDDYMDFIDQMLVKSRFNPIPLGLRSLLARWTTLLVGCSFADLNLRLLFRHMDQAVRPPMYSVDRSPDLLKRVVWEDRRRHMRFVVEDVWRFVPDLYERVLGEQLTPS